MVSKWGFDPERDAWSIDASERLLPGVFKTIFKANKIEFAWRSDIDRLDKQYGVDALLATPRRNVALAIRLRGRSYRHYGDVTVRYESLQTLGKMLEMQKSIARFLFYGWCDTDRPRPATQIMDWHVVKLQLLIDKFLRGQIEYRGPISNQDGSSTFVAFSPSVLKEHDLLLKSCTQTNKAPSLIAEGF